MFANGRELPYAKYLEPVHVIRSLLPHKKDDLSQCKIRKPQFYLLNPKNHLEGIYQSLFEGNTVTCIYLTQKSTHLLEKVILLQRWHGFWRDTGAKRINGTSD